MKTMHDCKELKAAQLRRHTSISLIVKHLLVDLQQCTSAYYFRSMYLARLKDALRWVKRKR